MQTSHTHSASPGGYGRNEPDEVVKVRLARSFEDIYVAFALRAIVYAQEQNCPFAEEFDGNDMFASHFIATVDGEPAGTTRVRFFAEFAKFERVAVRPQFRSTNVGDALIRHSLEHCKMKNYRVVYGHAEKALLPYWTRYGFRRMEKVNSLVFSDRKYFEVICNLDDHFPVENTITLKSDAEVINRPEGAWEKPGILEDSSVRSCSKE